MKKTIYIVRHGETDFNRNGIIQGSGVDSSLNTAGRQQSQAFFMHYQHVNFDLVLTSALKRTQQTVRPFIDSGIPWEAHPELNEMNWGVHEGQLSTPAMVAEYQAIKEEWSAGNYHAAIEQGESAWQLARRLHRFVDHLRQRSETRILVCSHGRAMCALVTILRQEELREMNRYKQANTGLWITHYSDGQFIVELENDIRHLEDLSTP